VQVPKLIALETYETVHQLVTTVRGQLLDGIGEVEAVKRSFPPGKHRSDVIATLSHLFPVRVYDWSAKAPLCPAARTL
jgi:hypothetical protein